MSFLEAFVARYFKSVEPTLVQSGPNGDWVIRVPVPVYAEVTLTQREVVSGRLSPEGFLRELAERARVAVDQVKEEHCL